MGRLLAASSLVILQFLAPVKYFESPATGAQLSNPKKHLTKGKTGK